MSRIPLLIPQGLQPTLHSKLRKAYLRKLPHHLELEDACIKIPDDLAQDLISILRALFPDPLLSGKPLNAKTMTRRNGARECLLHILREHVRHGPSLWSLEARTSPEPMLKTVLTSQYNAFAGYITVESLITMAKWTWIYTCATEAEMSFAACTRMILRRMNLPFWTRRMLPNASGDPIRYPLRTPMSGTPPVFHNQEDVLYEPMLESA